MKMIAQFSEAIRTIQNAAPDVKLLSIEVDKKTRDHLVFLIMQQDRQSPNPTEDQAERFGGMVSLRGVEIKVAKN
jgi:hypothetical protein